MGGLVFIPIIPPPLREGVVHAVEAGDLAWSKLLTVARQHRTSRNLVTGFAIKPSHPGVKAPVLPIQLCNHSTSEMFERQIIPLADLFRLSLSEKKICFRFFLTAW